VATDVGHEQDEPACSTGSTLDGAIAVMQQAHGFDISCFSAAFLGRSLQRRRERLSCQADTAYLERLAGDPAEAEVLVRSLRVGYSEFFRDPLAFALLERSVLPALAEKRARENAGEIRVWSAGCAAGQEAWSVAILLDELSAAQAHSVPYRVFATDTCEPDLAAARAGVYGEAAVGNVRARHLRDCFSRQGESFAIVPRLRERVFFSVYDLLDECTSSPPASIYGDIDLVLCCNVMLYYRPEVQCFILDKLRGSLASGGYLITGEAERQIVECAGDFRAVVPPAAVFRKTTQRS
jgi:chemotaxis methyl-accepting protein methylase